MILPKVGFRRILLNISRGFNTRASSGRELIRKTASLRLWDGAQEK